MIIQELTINNDECTMASKHVQMQQSIKQTKQPHITYKTLLSKTTKQQQQLKNNNLKNNNININKTTTKAKINLLRTYLNILH